MNMTPPQDEIPDVLPDKPKDAADLFEFRASEQDVVSAATAAETGGSNQSIYSAEEVNAEDSVFDATNGAANNITSKSQRTGSAGSLECGEQQQHRSTSTDRRCRSLGEEDAPNVAADCQSRGSSSSSSGSSSIRSFSETNIPTDITTTADRRNGTRSCENSPTTTSANRSSPPPPPTRSRTESSPTTTTHQCLRNSRTATACAIPPRWIPDTEAPRCMSCDQAFTTFRRRHHCRNCGGVFCGVCSNTSAPLPKFGLIKAVRVCRDCYCREVGN